MLIFCRRAGSFVRENSYDVVLAMSPVASADVYQPRGGLLAESMERNVATRSTATRRATKRALRAMNSKRRSLLELERAVFREPGPLIAAVSKYVATQCQRFYDVGAPRVRVVFNGVSVEPAQQARTSTPSF